MTTDEVKRKIKDLILSELIKPNIGRPVDQISLGTIDQLMNKIEDEVKGHVRQVKFELGQEITTLLQ